MQRVHCICAERAARRLPDADAGATTGHDAIGSPASLWALHAIYEDGDLVASPLGDDRLETLVR